MNTEQEQAQEAAPQAEAGEAKKMSRRDALAIMGKHAVYTAPVVMSVLNSEKALAFSF